jgi:hypothetical protein
VAQACNAGGRDQEDHGSRLAWAKSSRDPILKITNTQKKAGKVAQLIDNLPSKCRALSSSPSTTKKNKKKKRFEA